jgi:hypothetical protein
VVVPSALRVTVQPHRWMQAIYRCRLLTIA